jgi:simple sugar transport system ATP-binding protein
VTAQESTAGIVQTPAVELRGIVKRFPGVVANDGVDFALATGEVHALLGENGAGKSTLMSILDGLYQPDAGEILVDGHPVAFRSPRDAIAAGLGMVQQHFALVASMTVTENVLIGLDTPRFRLRLDRAHDEVARLAEAHGLRVDPKARIWQLSVGERQRVEILKVLYRGARVLIMDEPTAVLAPQEVDDLFQTLRSMTASGHSIVFISHKLGEVLAIADRITVMRRGRVTAAALPAAGATRAQLATLMVGRTIPDSHARAPGPRGDVVLSIQDVEALGDRGTPALRGVSLDVHAGEIVGIAGVAGNGQSELAEVVTGLRPCRGRVLVGGDDVANRPVRSTIRRGVAHVPEDRHGVGSAPNLSLVDNLIMKRYQTEPIARGWAIDAAAARKVATELKDAYEVAAPSIDTQARLLSGGNLQRVILAREIESGSRVMIAVQPTRGLDVGAVETVHRLLIQRRAAGAAILLVSEELDELLALADRIAVLYEGRIVGVIDTADADVEHLGLLMTGGDKEPTEPVAGGLAG